MTWVETIGITAIKFMNSNNLSKNYYGYMFVGDFNTGDIYHFKLDANRSNILSDSNMISEVEVNGENHSVIYQDPFSSCYNYFRCNREEFTGVTNNDLQNKSIIISTPLTSEYSWSWIYGLKYDVIRKYIFHYYLFISK